MGVRGIKHLLQGVGWVEESSMENDDDGCTGKLWKEWNASDAFLGNSNAIPPLEAIPSDARLFLDGNGLAFYLHSIAYDRYLQSLHHTNNNSAILVNSKSTRCQNQTCCSTTKVLLTDQQATVRALPCMLPLSILRTVTLEFISGIKPLVGQLVVLWDGPYRRFKAQTDRKRKLERDQQESYLELYFTHGTMVKKKRQTLKYACDWKEVFPFSKLFVTCVRHALREDINIEMVDCDEEADVELARRASGDQNSFVVGFDSDFFFYKDIQYIPLNRLSVRPTGLHAFVARRSTLSQKLGLLGDGDNGSDRLIDLALLMGNDYLDPFVSLNVPEEVDLTSVQSMVYYLQCHEDYTPTAKTKEGKAAADFTRSLYNLESLEEFPLDANTSVLDDGDFKSEADGKEMCLLPEETTVRQGILRYLQAKWERLGTTKKFPLSELTLQAFELSSVPEKRQQIPEMTKRPNYQDYKAAKIIERCITRFYRASPHSLLIRATPPDFLMSRIHFHAALEYLREQVTESEQDNKREESGIVEEAEALPSTEPMRLPIDEHEEAILKNIRMHRVTIIHGETGCGKSSRVPVMLLNAPPPDGSFRRVRFFISQPRRIAAKALVERVRSCEPALKDKFALRMGHGWKEYESKDTQAYFCTTGYLVRLLANHPERFDDCTHLVIDEVHERSVDTDILCLLCRRLLESNKDIRLVLMSATLATKMYREYFAVPNEPIHVGVRRYPITEYFVEDLHQFGLPEKEITAAMAIQKENETKFCIGAPSANEMKHRFSLTARLATIVGEPGASVLVFVPGMAEIIAISELIETYHTTGVRYTCFPIHGDIPFEEQMDAFVPPELDEVKIIIATNAAESSVTLPNVDHVICLGLCKQIVYNQASHRQMLTAAWISKASATQRAGRTGRIRPGNVYRLYTRMAFDRYLAEFEPGEMVRIPLDNVILMLKQILHEEVKPVFMDCLEPPALDTIDRSFQSLCYWNFITAADDKADITPLGSFVSSLGVDLSLGSFIGLGIQFGVAAEAIEMAAMMSLPKTPFMMTSPLWHPPEKFNKIASETLSAKCKFDAGLYSDPMGLMNALWDYTCLESMRKDSWCFRNNIAVKRWKQAVSSRKSLQKRVAEFLGIHEEKLQVQQPPREMPHEKVLILRVLKLWVFSDSIIECSPSTAKLSPDGSVKLSIQGRSSNKIEGHHLNNILQPDKHPFSIVEHNETEQSGVFQEEGPFSFTTYIEKFERRLISYASEMNIEIAVCFSNEELYLYAEKSKSGKQMLEYFQTIFDTSSRQDRFAYDYTNKKRRGIQERASGMWTVDEYPNSSQQFTRQKEFIRIQVKKEDLNGDFDGTCGFISREVMCSELKSKIIWHFFTHQSKKKKKKASSAQPFSVTTIGECSMVSNTDLEDLLGRKPSSVSINKKNCNQSILLYKSPQSGRLDDIGVHDPLFIDVPESARILALLASSQRKDKYTLKIPYGKQSDSEETLNFEMKEAEIDISMRWRRLNSDNKVFVDESVPSSAIHTTNSLFGVAAVSLELQRGGLRVGCLTLLPPNPLFLILSHLAFGLNISAPSLWALTYNGETDDENKKVKKAYTWLAKRATIKSPEMESSGDNGLMLGAPSVIDSAASKSLFWKEEELKRRLLQANAFHESCSSMGEKLLCFPEKIRELCELFDGVDGHNLTPWPSIPEEALTAENLRQWQWERKSSTKESHQTISRQYATTANKTAAPPKAARHPNPIKNIEKSEKAEKLSKNIHLEQQRIRHFDNQLILSSKKLFATSLNAGEDMPTFPSTNILALLFQLFETQVQSENYNLPLQSLFEKSGTKKGNFKIELDASNWHILCLKKDDSSLYQAHFVNKSIDKLSVVGRGKNKLPKWIKKYRGRPSTIAEANECVPPNVACPRLVETDHDGIWCESIPDALTMEAAFWLNQQFCHAGKDSTRQWYTNSMDQMVDILRQKHKTA